MAIIERYLLLERPIFQIHDYEKKGILHQLINSQPTFVTSPILPSKFLQAKKTWRIFVTKLNGKMLGNPWEPIRINLIYTLYSGLSIEAPKSPFWKWPFSLLNKTYLCKLIWSIVTNPCLQHLQLQLQIFICNILHFSFQFLFSLDFVKKEWTPMAVGGQQLYLYIYIYLGIYII